MRSAPGRSTKRATTIALALLSATAFLAPARAESFRVEVRTDRRTVFLGETVRVEARLFSGEEEVPSRGSRWRWVVAPASGELRGGETTDAAENVWIPAATGTFTIRATTQRSVKEGVWGEVTLVVKDGPPPPPAEPVPAVPAPAPAPAGEHVHSFTVTPAVVNARVGEALRFTYGGCGCHGRWDVAWTLPSGLRYDRRATIVAETAGSYQVKVTAGQLSTWVKIVVLPSSRVARVDVLPVAVSVKPGESFAFQATAYDEDGTPLALGLEFRASGGGTVAADGTFTAGAVPGRFQILARDPNTGINGSAWVTIEAARNVHAIAAGPRFARCRAGEWVQLGVRAHDAENREIPCPPVRFTCSSGVVDQACRFFAPEAPGTHVLITVREPRSGRTDVIDVYVCP